MTLREFLDKADADTVYYIGAVDGGSFFFVGTPDGALRDLEDISKEKIAVMKNSAKYARSELARLKKDMADIENPTKRQKDYLKRKMTNLKNMRRRVKDWVPLLDREVVEAYKRKTGGVAVIVSGYCAGGFWSIEEYNKVKKPRSKMDLHPNGVENLRTAILARAAIDYKDAIIHKAKTGTEFPEADRTTGGLEHFFRGHLFESICDYDGEAVIKMCQQQAEEEMKEKEVSNA